MFHFEAFMPVMIFVFVTVFFVVFEVSGWASMRVTMILFKEPRRASMWMAVYMNMLWGRVNNNRSWMNKNWSRLYYHRREGKNRWCHNYWSRGDENRSGYADVEA